MTNVCVQTVRFFCVFTVVLLNGALQGQTIIKNFSGVSLGDDIGLGFNITPPDTMGAAGTNQFVQFINGAFAVYNKAGVRQSLISDVTFWENAGISAATISAGLSDTRITYDAGSGRWFASEITVNATGNRVLVGRSDSSDPSGTWKATNFVASSTAFGDYDTLGVDSLGVYIGVNVFSSRGVFTGVSFFSIPKADLLASTPTLANMTRFDNLSDQTYGFTLQGVCNPDAGRGHGVIIAIDNAAFKFFDRTTINGPGAAGATLSSTVRISNTYDASPNPAAQPSGQTVDALDHRFSGAVRQIGGYIFMANTILQGSKDAVHWMVLNETNNNIAGEGIISDPGYDFFQPSIAASHNGKILLGFNRSGATSPAGDISVYAAVGAITNGIVTMGSPFGLKAGNVSNFSISFDFAPYRWGDFSATMLDPTDDNLLWTIQEIPASSTSWGTQITLISMATNRSSLAIKPAQYAFASYYTDKNGHVSALSNLVSVQLSWPLSADPAFILKSSTNLAIAPAWTVVTNVPVVSINQNLVTLAVTNRATFFRLEK
jgi:hypothetical protein